MGSLRLLVTALGVCAFAVLYTEAAPTDLLGPPRTLEGDTDVNPKSVSQSPLIDESLNRKRGFPPKQEEEVETNERFHRIYDDGTVEFKTDLSNGHVQYQRISNKVVDGKTIQVYEGYISQKYADGTYGTYYYTADENGYRRTKVEVDTKPPVLPKSGPHAPDVARTNEQGSESETKVPASRSDDHHTTTGAKNLGEDVSTGETVVPTAEDNLSNETSHFGEDVAKRQIIPGSGEQTIKEKDENSTENENQEPVLPINEENAGEVIQNKPSTEGATVTAATKENVVNTNEATSEGYYGVQQPASPITEGTVNKATDGTDKLPSVDEILSTAVDENVDHSETGTDISASPVTEENVDKVPEYPEQSSELPTVKENPSKAGEGLDEISTDLPQVSTDLPEIAATEENLVKVEGDHEKSLGESVAEEGSSSSSQESEEHKAIDKELPEEGTNLLEASATEDSLLKAEEGLGGSPGLEIDSSSTVTADGAGLNEVSTDLPEVVTEIPEVVKDLAEVVTNLPEVPSTEETSIKAEEDLQTSPELPISEENPSTATEDDADHKETVTELPEVVTILPDTASEDTPVKAEEQLGGSTGLATAEENSITVTKDGADQNEISTDLPEEATEIPEVVKDLTEVVTDLPEVASAEETSVKVEEDLQTSPESPISEDNLSTVTEDDAEHKEIVTDLPEVVTEIPEVVKDLPEVSATEETLVKAGGDLETSPVLTTSDENSTSLIEDSADHSEANLPEEAITEKNLGKNEEDLQTSSLLPTSEKTSSVLTEHEEDYIQIGTSYSEAKVPKIYGVEETLVKGDGDHEISEKNSHASTEEGAEQSEVVTDLPVAIPDLPEVAATEGTLLKSEEALQTSSVTEENSSTHIDADPANSEASTEIPALPETEQGTEKVSEDPEAEENLEAKSSENLGASLGLPAEDISEAKVSEDLGVSSELPTEDSSQTTTEVEEPTSPVTEKGILKAFEDEIPILIKTIEEYITGHSSSTNPPELPVTEETSVKAHEDLEVSTEVPVPTVQENTEKVSEDEAIEGSAEGPTPTTSEVEIAKTSEEEDIGGELPTTQGTTEDEAPEASTELPTVEESVNKSNENEVTLDEISKGLTAVIEDKDLEIITEVPKIEDTEVQSSAQDNHEDETTSESSGLETSEENVTKVELDEGEKVEVSAWPITEESLHKVIKKDESDISLSNTEENGEGSFEASTEIPAIPIAEEDLSKHNEEDQAQKESNPWLPTLSNVEGSGDDNLEASSEVPAIPKAEESLSKPVEEGVPQKKSNPWLPTLSNVEGSEDDNLEASPEVPALPIPEENLIKPVEEDVPQKKSNPWLPTLPNPEESQDKHLEVPVLPTLEEHSYKSIKQQSEIGTGLSSLDVTSEPVPTEVPALPVSDGILPKTDETDVAQFESISEPALDVTSDTVEASTELPMLPTAEEKTHAEGRSLDGTVLPASNVNATKTIIESEKDLLASENTQNSAAKTSENEVLQNEEKHHETEAKVQEVPKFEENEIKTAEEDVNEVEATAPVIIAY